MAFAVLAVDHEKIARRERRRAEKLALKKAEAEAARGASTGTGQWTDMVDSDEEQAPIPIEVTDSSEAEEQQEVCANAPRERIPLYSPPAPKAAAIEPTKKPLRTKKEKVVAAEDQEIDALLAQMDVAAGSGDEQAKEVSKSAQRRAKKKAEAIEKQETKPAESSTPATEEAPLEAEDDSAVPKSPEEVRAMMKAKVAAAAAKEKLKAGSGSAAAIASAEAKAREAANKKKKNMPTFQTGGKTVGPKARGSDGKYQGE